MGKLITTDEYIGTILVNDLSIEIGKSANASNFYFTFVNGESQIEEYGCGPLNLHFIEEIYSIIDNHFHKLYNKLMNGTIEVDEAEELEQYLIRIKEHYKELGLYDGIYN